jgi:hypothetical protein
MTDYRVGMRGSLLLVGKFVESSMSSGFFTRNKLKYALTV